MTIHRGHRHNEPRMTGHDWNKVFKLEFEDYKGFLSNETFMNDIITKDEFVLRASNCKIKHNANNTRREATKYRQILGYKQDL